MIKVSWNLVHSYKVRGRAKNSEANFTSQILYMSIDWDLWNGLTFQVRNCNFSISDTICQSKLKIIFDFCHFKHKYKIEDF